MRIEMNILRGLCRRFLSFLLCRLQQLRPVYPIHTMHNNYPPESPAGATAPPRPRPHDDGGDEVAGPREDPSVLHPGRRTLPRAGGEEPHVQRRPREAAAEHRPHGLQGQLADVSPGGTSELLQDYSVSAVGWCSWRRISICSYR